MGVDNLWALITELIKKNSCYNNDDLPLTKPNCNGETSSITLSTILLYTNLSVWLTYPVILSDVD